MWCEQMCLSWSLLAKYSRRDQYSGWTGIFITSFAAWKGQNMNYDWSNVSPGKMALNSLTFKASRQHVHWYQPKTSIRLQPVKAMFLYTHTYLFAPSYLLAETSVNIVQFSAWCQSNIKVKVFRLSAPASPKFPVAARAADKGWDNYTPTRHRMYTINVKT